MRDKGKGVLGEEPSRGNRARDRCFRCHGFGHFMDQCPTRTLAMDVENEETPLDLEGDVEVYEPPSDLVDEFEEYADVTDYPRSCLTRVESLDNPVSENWLGVV